MLWCSCSCRPPSLTATIPYIRRGATLCIFGEMVGVSDERAEAHTNIGWSEARRLMTPLNRQGVSRYKGRNRVGV